MRATFGVVTSRPSGVTVTASRSRISAYPSSSGVPVCHVIKARTDRARAPPDLPVKQALGGLPAAALQSEEFESFLDELRVELEDAAVAGVGVGHQLTVRQAAGQVG
jgi:hypothetical protein